MTAMTGTVAGWLCALFGVLALQRAWRGRPVRSSGMLAGWGLLTLGLFGWMATTGGDVAVALALLVPSLVAYAVLAAGAKIKGARASRATRSEVELELSPSAPWRAILRTAYAGPLAALAAFSCGAAVAMKAPWPEADRLIAGGMLAPVLWAAGMIWASTDSRLSRIGLGLAAAAIASLAAAKA
jgi:hypothetical protein